MFDEFSSVDLWQVYLDKYICIFFCRFTLYFYMDGNKQKKERKKKEKNWPKKTKKFYIQSKNCHKFFKTQCLACDIVRKDLFNNNSVSNTDFSGFSNIYFKTKKQLRHMQVINLNFVKINFQQSLMWWLI